MKWRILLLKRHHFASILRVPHVKMGDTVYIFERGSYIIPICGQGKPHWEIKIEKCSFKYWLLDNHKFGVNMFSTREEAEKALKESEDNV